MFPNPTCYCPGGHSVLTSAPRKCKSILRTIQLLFLNYLKKWFKSLALKFIHTLEPFWGRRLKISAVWVLPPEVVI